LSGVFIELWAHELGKLRCIATYISFPFKNPGLGRYYTLRGKDIPLLTTLGERNERKKDPTPFCAGAIIADQSFFFLSMLLPLIVVGSLIVVG